MTVPEGFRLERGLLWPATDVGAAAAVFDTLGDLDHVYPLCRDFGVAVQAGGNCGVWPAAMAKRFGAVYTFEPEAVNFRCLVANATAGNVYKFQAALGDRPGFAGMARRPDNVGAHQVDGDGTIPIMRLDALGLPRCDLIQLDIEGYELFALMGARDTIAQHRPVIVIEDKGMSTRYGVAQGVAGRWLTDVFGYHLAAQHHRDLVYVR